MRNNRASPFYTTSLVLLCAVGLIAAVLLAAVPSGSQNVTIKTKPITYTHPDDGRNVCNLLCPLSRDDRRGQWSGRICLQASADQLDALGQDPWRQVSVGCGSEHSDL